MMSTEELLEIIEQDTLLDDAMIKAAFDFWFNDHKEIRSPFPEYIRPELTRLAMERAIAWAKRIPAEKRKELNDEINAERFEELLFDEGMKLVKTEDEKLTIKYPFMPRIGDPIQVKKGDELVANHVIIERHISKDGDMTYMKVKYKDPETGNEEETSFELPE